MEKVELVMRLSNRDNTGNYVLNIAGGVPYKSFVSASLSPTAPFNARQKIVTK